MVAGIWTDACVIFAALSAVECGYHVPAVTDAFGTWSEASQASSINRMSAAGITINSTVAVTAEL